MTLDRVASRCFRQHEITVDPLGVATGTAITAEGIAVAIAGVAEGRALGIEAAGRVAAAVLAAIEAGERRPVVVSVATDSQKMARGDELLGLYEHLAHLAKALLLAGALGHRTIGVLHGRAAAGAFIATALATDTLVALPGAEPSVMDLPSIARITRLSPERLEEMARSTPIFAPGLDALARTGAVREIWGEEEDWSVRLDAVLGRPAPADDDRAALGAERGGRLVAASVAERVRRLVVDGADR